MGDRSASWFRNLAVGSAALAVVMVPVVNGLIHGSLPLWLHIPLVVVGLTLLAGGAMVSGVAYLEYQSRTGGSKEA